MPQAIPVVTTLIATSVTENIAWHLVAYIAGALASSALMPDESPYLDTSGGRQVMVNARSTRTPLKVVYGECRVGGNDVFAVEAGQYNEYLYVIQTLSEGEIKGVKQVGENYQLYLNDKLIDDLNDDGDPFYPWEYASYWIYNGSADQESFAPLSELGFRECYRNTAIIIWRFKYNPNIFTALPKRTAVVEGIKLFDIRDDTTYYNANCVLVLYDFMTNTRYGLGYNSDLFDLPSWQAAANYCDAKGWETNLALYLDKENARDIINKLLSYFRGNLVWYDGKLYLKYADLNYESVSMELTDDLLCRGPDGRASVSIHQPSKIGVPDGLRVSYVDPNKDYVSDEFPVGDEEGVIDTLNLPGCKNREHAGALAIYNLERTKINKVLSGVWRDDTIKLDPHDLVTINSDLLGFKSQILRVQKSKTLNSNLVELSMIWEEERLYNDIYDVTVEDIYSTTISSPTNVVPNVLNVVFEELPYYIKNLSYERLVITWEFPPYYPFVDHIEVWISQDEENWTFWGSAYDSCDFKPVNETEKWYFKFRTVNVWSKKQDILRTSIWVHDVVGDVGYPGDVTGFHALVASDKVSLTWDNLDERNMKHYSLRWGDTWRRSIHLFDIQDTSKALTGVKPGDHKIWIAAETNLSRFSANPQYVNFTVYLPTLYEETFSYEDDFTTGIFSGTEKYTDPTYGDVLRVDRGISDDTSWNTWTGASESVLWTDLVDEGDTWSDLMNNLNGYWESAEKNLGGITKARVWDMFDLVAFVPGGTTWNDWFNNNESMLWTELFTYETMTWEDIEGAEEGLLDDGMTWNRFLLYDEREHWSERILSSESTWSQLFQIPPAGDMYMILYYKKYAGDSWSEAHNFEILSMEIEAQYLKYRIYLEDSDINSRIMIKSPATLKGYYWRS